MSEKEERAREYYDTMIGDTARKKSLQSSKGKLTARERIDLLVDKNSFCEVQPYMTSRSQDFGMGAKHVLGDGVITGTGMIEGKQVCIAAQDFTVLGGSLGEMHAERIAEIQKLAFSLRVPMIQLNDSGGARIQEGVMALHGYGKIFRSNTLCSGVIPQISIILGPCAGGAVYSPAITDFIVMVNKVSNMYITGPEVIREVMGEQIDHEGLGGSKAHMQKSGNAHLLYETEQEAFSGVRRLISYLPQHNGEKPPVEVVKDRVDRKTKALKKIIPESIKRSYDMKECIQEIVDKNSFFEIHEQYAANIVVGFARIGGLTVGLCANQPKVFAGTLDINSSDKAARFIRFCDTFNIPLIMLVDVPGYLPGVAQEHGGVIRHGAKLLYAIAEATVPKISLIMRKAYGGAFIAMASKSLGYDRVLAYPEAEIGVMGAEGAANIIFRKEIAQADDQAATKAKMIETYREKVMNPFIPAGYGVIDDIIDVEDTRVKLYQALQILSRKHEQRPEKKHGNIPL